MVDPDQIPHQIKEFLTSRRAKITPDDVGLPVAAGNRRVPGLRREEVAVLANISLEYYTRTERGTKEVLDLPDTGQSLAAYAAPPDSRTADSLDLLASWAAIHRPPHDVEKAPGSPPTSRQPCDGR